MKKTATILFFVMLLGTTAFADGDLPNGDRCKSGCFVENNDGDKTVDSESYLSFSLFIKIRDSIQELLN